MPKEEWGKKRLCPETNKRFYDLNRDPVISPYTGKIVDIGDEKDKTIISDKEDAQAERAQDILVDDDDTDNVDLDDDMLDDDDDTVPLDDLADIAANDEEDN